MRRLSPGLFPLLILAVLLCPALASGGQAPGATPAPVFPAPTAAERAARPALARSEQDIGFLEVKLTREREKLAALSGETIRLDRERQAIESDLEALKAKLRTLLPVLWAMNVRLKGMMDASVAPWDESDRSLTWLGSVFGMARQEFAKVSLKNHELASNLEKQARLRPEEREQDRQVEDIKYRLLLERYKLLDELSPLRREKLSPRQELERIIALAAQANLSPPQAMDRPIDMAAGTLLRPLEGMAAGGFDPEISPPSPGVGIAALAGTPVKAVHWGRVAFAGPVKGLGKVVVLAHGGKYLSVYAGLSEASVKPGQDVDRGDVLGKAGKVPATGQSGMSFELRFGTKPINPDRWFLAG